MFWLFPNTLSIYWEPHCVWLCVTLNWFLNQLLRKAWVQTLGQGWTVFVSCMQVVGLKRIIIMASLTTKMMRLSFQGLSSWHSYLISLCVFGRIWWDGGKERIPWSWVQLSFRLVGFESNYHQMSVWPVWKVVRVEMFHLLPATGMLTSLLQWLIQVRVEVYRLWLGSSLYSCGLHYTC